jgi:hypothetical protein
MVVDEGETFGLPIAIDLPPGEHVVRFEGDRYAPVERTITLVPGSMTNLGNVRLAVARGVVTFELATPGAVIVLENQTGDRRQLPTTPLSVQFSSKDRWVVEATKAGYCTYTQPIDFSDGIARKTLRIELQQGCAP